MTAANRPAAGGRTGLVSVVLLAITIVATAQLVVASRLTAHAAVQDAVRQASDDAAAIERRAAAFGGNPSAAEAAAQDATATIAALPGVRSVTLHPAHDTTLDAFAIRVLADRRAAVDERTTGDATVRVAAAVHVADSARVLELRIDPRPAARSALAPHLAAAGLLALGLAALAAAWLLVSRRRLSRRHRLAVLAALTDDVTGLPNRRAFLRRLTVAARQARTGDAPLTLVLLEIAGLEHVTAAHGHSRGEELLAGVAEVLDGTDRAGTEAFRVGGSCFALLMPATGADQAYGVTARVLDGVHAVAAQVGGDVAAAVTGAAGLSVLGADSPDADALLAGAEAALQDARVVAAVHDPVDGYVDEPAGAARAVEVPAQRTPPPAAQVAAAYAASGPADERGADEGLGLRGSADPWDIRWITGWEG
jgi:diguanylate cyclase (GGDEF)-like protein